MSCLLGIEFFDPTFSKPLISTWRTRVKYAKQREGESDSTKKKKRDGESVMTCF